MGGRIVEMDYPGVRLFVSSNIEKEVRRKSCEKEPETVRWIEGFKAREVFYDIGANVGAYSFVAVKNGCIAYGFEPGFENYAAFCRNILLNGFTGIASAFPIALSDKTCVDIFRYGSLEPGAALHCLGYPVDYRGNQFCSSIVQDVLSYRLDDFVRYFNVRLPDHVKIDVDGKEIEVLEGMGELLDRVKSLMVEININNRCCDYLLERGFREVNRVGANAFFKSGG
jgi:FkbM family methyltransferase